MKTDYEKFQERLRNNDIAGAPDHLIASAVKAKKEKNVTNKKTLDEPVGKGDESLKKRRKAIEAHPNIYKNIKPENSPRGYTPAEWKDYRKRHYGE